jgi:hypothetical protein
MEKMEENPAYTRDSHEKYMKNVKLKKELSLHVCLIRYNAKHRKKANPIPINELNCMNKFGGETETIGAEVGATSITTGTLCAVAM